MAKAREGRFEDLPGVQRNNMFLVEVDKIKTQDGWNARRDFGDIEGLAAKIQKRGILQPLRVRREGNDIVLVAGERRLRAVQLLQEKGVPFEKVPCVLANRNANESDNFLDMLAENADRKDLTPIEEAEGFKRLISYGLDEAKIAEEYGCSVSTVQNRLELLKASPQARKALQDGRVSPAAVLQLLRGFENREEQDGALTDAMEAAGPNGTVSKTAARAARASKGREPAARVRAMPYKDIDVLQRRISKVVSSEKPPEGGMRFWEGLRMGLRIAMHAEPVPEFDDGSPKKPQAPTRTRSS